MRKILALLSVFIVFGLCAIDEEIYAADPVVIDSDKKQTIIPLQIEDTSDGTLKAKILQVKKAGSDMGLDQLILNGHVTDTEILPSKKKEITIEWDSVELKDKQSTIASPFTSTVTVKDIVKAGNKFSAKGSISDLVAAVKQMGSIESKQRSGQFSAAGASASSLATKGSNDTATTSSAPQAQIQPTPATNTNSSLPTGGGQTSQVQPTIPTVAPTITAANTTPAAPSVTETADGCTIRVDTAQMVAIVQKKLIIGGTDNGCNDSDVRYPLTKDYSTCPLQIDNSALSVMKQYTLGYENPTTNARVVATGCTADTQTQIAMNEVADGCPVTYDFTAKKAVQQTQLVYTLDGRTVQRRGCADSPTVYTLVETNDTCPVNTASGSAVQQTKFTYTDATGKTVLARDCQDSATLYTVTETKDGCSIRYDFTKKIAVQQTRLVYIANGKTVEQRRCQDSATTFPLAEIADSCPVTNGGSVMIQQTKFTYTDSSNQTIVAKDCQNSAITYPILETKDGCSMRYDFVAGTGNEQHRLVYMVASKPIEQRSCQDSLVTVKLQEINDSCPIVPETNVAVQQTKFVYTDSSNQTIVARDCSDGKVTYPLVTTKDTCIIRNDFAAGRSIQQVHVIYMLNSVPVEVQPCADSTDAALIYPHQTTRATCDPIVTASTVTKQSRKYITVNGNTQYVTTCTPDSDSLTIQSDECTGTDRFTNDFAAGQSYLNKTFWYMDGTNKIILSSCKKTETTYPHEYHPLGCPVTNDDDNKQTIINGKTVIDVSGTQVIIQDTCQPIGQPVPYVKVSEQWAAATTAHNVPITGSNMAATTELIEAYNFGNSFIGPTGWRVSVYAKWVGYLVFPYLTNTGAVGEFDSQQYIYVSTDRDLSSNVPQNYVYTTQYCRDANLALPWRTPDGKTVDSSRSNDRPLFTPTITQNSYGYGSNGCRALVTAPGRCFDQQCTQPTCALLTSKTKYGTYQRSDGTQYMDTANPLDFVQVCGSGTLL